MIVKMNKYSFVVLTSKRDEFLGRLQQLGLVDVTTAGWEPSENDRRVMLDADRYKAAVAKLETLAKDPRYAGGKAYENGDEAFDRYIAAEEAVGALQAEIARLQKYASEAEPWGEFDAEVIKNLREQGVVLHFFVTQTGDFDRNVEEWSKEYTVERVSDAEGQTYFVVVTRPSEEVMIDAQELKPLTMTVFAERGHSNERNQEDPLPLFLL